MVSENLGKKLPRKDYHVITIALDLDLFKPMDKAEARAQLGLPADHAWLCLSAATPRILANGLTWHSRFAKLPVKPER